MANLRINGATPANVLLGTGLSASPHDVFGNTTISVSLNALGGPFLTPAAAIRMSAGINKTQLVS